MALHFPPQSRTVVADSPHPVHMSVMELSEFARRVLFGTTLEEKLHCPAVITDEHPGAPIASPAAPGRPGELRFKASGAARGGFPGVRRLEQERERGRLLHFFANHELLATELMALALLRFPDAPASFRRGLLRTLQDEQGHTRLYLQRMKDCGIHFGELPVSGYFWRAVSGMESPLDYVTGLCLTFEQANLDFARHFARGFAAVGDAPTSALLERICHDEIGHVAYGLKWFRRWKNPNETDWDAFCRQLKFPLSPQRAKGFALNVEGRRAAGFDADFIAGLDVYSQSKGRTPNVFVFNPFAEAHIAQGRSFSCTKTQAQLARDLGNLPQFLCRQDDIVLVETRPSVRFLSGIKQAGFALPEFVELSRASSLGERKLGRLRPWAWSPDSVELLKPFFANLTAEERTVDGSFNPALAGLYSKAWSAALLKKFLARVPKEGVPWLCTEQEVGIAVKSVAEAMETIAAIRARGQSRIVVKQALGLAGSNAIRLFEPELLDAQRRWMADELENKRPLVIEPWLDRVIDFSVQLEMTSAGLKLRGYTGLITGSTGQFRGNWAAPHFERRLAKQVSGYFVQPVNSVRRLQVLYEELFSLLESELQAADYLGPLGIDAFVYRTADGEHRLKPIVEINPRHTMGRVTLELMHHACPGSYGVFRLLNRKAAQAEGCSDFPAYAALMAKRFPLRLEGSPVARIREGALCLNDPEHAQVCLAVFQVDRDFKIISAAARGSGAA